jgi:probable rRNA maturation factor
MEKELLEIQHKNLNLYFYYTKDLIKESEIADYAKWLNLSVEAIHAFINNQKPFSLNVSLVDDQEIKDINKEYRGKNKVTDVLSFPMQENMRQGLYDDFMHELELGDILICKSVCEKQAIEFKLDYMEEFVHLLIHGFLHVYGYDHEISLEEEKIMTELEENLVIKISELKRANFK